MSRTIMQSTQIRMTLSVQMEFDSPAGDELIRLLLWSLAWLAMRFLQVRLWAGRIRYEVTMFRQDFSEAAAVILKLWAIAFNSWAWALGVKV